MGCKFYAINFWDVHWDANFTQLIFGMTFGFHIILAIKFWDDRSCRCAVVERPCRLVDVPSQWSMNLLGLFRVDEQFSGTGPVAIRVLPCNPDERHAVLKMSLMPSLGRWTKVC